MCNRFLKFKSHKILKSWKVQSQLYNGHSSICESLLWMCCALLYINDESIKKFHEKVIAFE